MKKAIGYVRVSTTDQAISPKFQETEILNFCKENGYECEIFKDIGVGRTAPIDEREGLTGAINKLKKGYLFVVYKLDRLAGDLLLQLSIEDIVKRKKCDFISIIGEGTGIGQDTPEREMLKNIIAVFAEFERSQIRKRTKNALEQLRREGKVSGTIPYGFKREGDLILDCEEELEIIECILSLRKNMSFDKIVKFLNNEGVKTRNGNPWRKQQIYNIVVNNGKPD